MKARRLSATALVAAWAAMAAARGDGPATPPGAAAPLPVAALGALEGSERRLAARLDSEATIAANTSARARLTRHAVLRLRSRQVPAPRTPWTSGEPDSTDYNEETRLRGFQISAETFCAICYIALLASTPFLLAALSKEGVTRAHVFESVVLTAWLSLILFLFTNLLKFQSSHFEGHRPLTLVEAVYLLSQILTTVGYGDITPAFPRGQVWVGFNVILALCLYGSMICEVVEIVHKKLQAELMEEQDAREPGQPLKDWTSELTPSKSPVISSFLWYLAIAGVGICFFHLYPGEDKTWLQAAYMSIITLSTVGFGAFTATTEGGKIFAAFWMLLGVAALGALVTNFINWMMLEKQVERRHLAVVQAEFKQTLLQASGGKKKMTKAEFLRFGLMLTRRTDYRELDLIDQRYKNLLTGKDDRFLRRTDLVDNEGPPL